MGSIGNFFVMDSDGRANTHKIECLLFDMDDTLYPLSSGLNLACRKNIEEFMLDRLQFEKNEVPRLCLELYREHGTTMAGFGYEFDNDEFHAYPDPVLRNLLLSMPQRKIIFTNADKVHAAEVLKRLGLEDCFEGIICFETLNPSVQSVDYSDETAEREPDPDDLETYNWESSRVKSRILCKPSLEAMEAAIRIADVDPNKTYCNIAAGKEAGLHTVIVGSSVLVPGAEYALSSIHNIKEAIPEIWEVEGDEQLEQVIPTSTAVENVVLA
ncbi:hypothetical protein K2173_004834 [Erythroxylum novogranatense]|uniref:Suppressor of disruption of TFIIS-like n=1 Tax=Erythroxylum novogranatense TaxID=1862640 RepID=A0AAV8U8D4_9ROSI|nr:hypothetical protein K2173_004834 [Erythroxylum novogranatense]